MHQFTNMDDFYQFIHEVESACRDNGYKDIARSLDDALHLGSSGLEITGAIGGILNANAIIIERLLDAERRERLKQAIALVDLWWGRQQETSS